MSDIKKVKEEPAEEFDDALRTLASAAIEQDLLPPIEQQLQNEPVPVLLQQQQADISDQVQLPQTVKQETKLMNTLVPNSNPSHSRLTVASVLNPPWFDVGIVRKPSCIIKEFYFTETTIDHSADTSDNLPDYRGLHKLALLPGVAYKFRVAAINSCGIGEWSDVVAFKTCSPGYPGAPCRIRVLKSSEGVTLGWEPPVLRYGKIIEYSVCLCVKNEVCGNRDAINVSHRESPFVRVYCGTENCAFVENSSLTAAQIDPNPKPAIIFRIAARNEKGYGPATQVRWLTGF